MVDFNKNQHSVFRLTYHVVFVVKYRRKVITDEMSDFMKAEADRLLANKGCSLVEFNHDRDHVHAIIEMAPTDAPATVVCSLKTQLSKSVRAHFRDEIMRLLWGDAFWTESYFICTTGGVTIDVLRKYVEAQRTDDHKRKYVKSGSFSRKKK